jgi:phosphoenolpyruvate synthase/pyruvate phosphate dikinase
MDIVYHTSGIESVDAAIRARALAKREVTEKYSDMMHTIYLDFWSRVFPQYADITYVLLPDETVRLGRGEMSEAEITSIRGRLSGFALLNERVYTNEEMFRQLSARHITLASEDVSGLTELKGSTAYPGVVRGKVRLLRFRELIQTLEAGEILVTEMTDPDFVPAIKKAAAVVTDEGGVMCHAAIVSRELQKPCIVGTKLATKYLKDGDMVEVDATNGIVRKI